MKNEVIDLKGNKVESVELNDSVWGSEFNSDLVAQVITVFNSNQRRGTAHAKRRGDVSGGGRKPWKQKGTGRARQGSTRSPIWTKGGVTFVPNYRNWNKGVNKDMVKKSLAQVASKLLNSELVSFVKFSEAKNSDYRNFVTKNYAEKFNNVLIITQNESIIRSLRNMSNVEAVSPEFINVRHLTGADYVVFESDSVKIFENRLTNGE